MFGTRSLSCCAVLRRRAWSRGLPAGTSSRGWSRNIFASLDATLYRWHIPNGRSVTAVTTELAADRGIGWAQPNYIHRTQQSVAGEGAEKTQSEGEVPQYALAKLHLTEAHGLAKGDKVLVAVIDSGIDASHPDLRGVMAGQF